MADNYELGGAEMESLEFPCDPTSLPTSSKLPLGDVILEIKSIEVTKSAPNLTGEKNKRGEVRVGEKKMVKVQFALDEPEDSRGIPYTHNFVIGSDQDPQGEKAGTWKRNGTLLMAMYAAARVGGKTHKEYMAAAVGQKVGSTVKLEKSRDPNFDDKNVPKAFWAPGTKQVRVIDEPTVSGGMLAGPATPQPAFESRD